MNTVKKTVHQLKAGDIVHAHGCKFKVTTDAVPSLSHGTRAWSANGFTYFPEAPDCAVAESVCIEGAVQGYIAVGKPWTFQGNFKASSYTVEI